MTEVCAPPWAATIMGVRIDRLDPVEAPRAARHLIREAGPADRARLIFTPNPEMLHRAGRDPAFRDALNAADLAVPDGVGVVWGLRLLGWTVPGRVAGFDLLVRLLEEEWTGGRRGAPGRLRVFLLGGVDGVAREAAERIGEVYAEVEVVGTHHGYFTDDAPVLRAITAAHPELLVAGMGSPKQELWLTRHRAALAGMTAIGVGGSLDVLSGKTRRAPRWVQRAHLEWLYRTVTQPRSRLRRLPALAGFALDVLGEALRNRTRRQKTAGGE